MVRNPELDSLIIEALKETPLPQSGIENFIKKKLGKVSKQGVIQAIARLIGENKINITADIEFYNKYIEKKEQIQSVKKLQDGQLYYLMEEPKKSDIQLFLNQLSRGKNEETHKRLRKIFLDKIKTFEHEHNEFWKECSNNVIMIDIPSKTIFAIELRNIYLHEGEIAFIKTIEGIDESKPLLELLKKRESIKLWSINFDAINKRFLPIMELIEAKRLFTFRPMRKKHLLEIIGYQKISKRDVNQINQLFNEIINYIASQKSISLKDKFVEGLSDSQKSYLYINQVIQECTGFKHDIFR